MTALQVSAQKQLRQYIEQVERLEEEKKGLSGDIREKYQEAKGNGFDPRAMRRMIKLRKKTEQERAEEEAIEAVYMQALGMLADTPLGEFAVEAARPARISPRLVKSDSESVAAE